MTVTVLGIIDPVASSAAPLAKVMNERLYRLAGELQQIHLKELESVEPLFEDVVVYIGYNSKYTIRWRIVNDVSEEVQRIVEDKCGALGYIKWKIATVNIFKGY